MATRKPRRFVEGGVTDEDLEAANASEDPIETLNARKNWTGGEEASEPAPARKQSFKEAFAEARRGGGKTFEWNGKKYTTEMAGEKSAAPRAAAKPAARSMATDTGDEMARLRARAPAPKPKYETAYDRMNRRNREEAEARAASTPRGQDRILRDVRPSGAVNPKTLLPTGMKKGGSVSKASGRADGIAMRGKTRGKIY